MRKIFIAWLLFFSSVVNAQTDAPVRMNMPVRVLSFADDGVGQKLVYAVQEAVEKSSYLRITDDSEPNLSVSIVTMDGDEEEPAGITIYGVTWFWDNPEQPFGFYLGANVGRCGSARVEECAHAVLEDTHRFAENMFKLIMDGLESEKEGSGSK